MKAKKYSEEQIIDVEGTAWMQHEAARLERQVPRRTGSCRATVCKTPGESAPPGAQELDISAENVKAGHPRTRICCWQSVKPNGASDERTTPRIEGTERAILVLEG